MNKKMAHEQSLLFDLISSSLWKERYKEPLFNHPETDWNELILLAARQGVLGVSCDGLLNEELSASGVSKGVTLRWNLSVMNIEAKNEKMRLVLKELASVFRENGIELLLLKGIGLGLNYPIPDHRESGDIDIYLFGDFEKGNRVIEDMGIDVDRTSPKHSLFYIKGIPVENHEFLLNVQSSKIDVNLEERLHAILEEQGCDTIMVDGIQVKVPTPDFNAIFLTRHDITHFLASGLVLRHFNDLALFFIKNRDRINFADFEKVMKREGQYNLICSFLALSQKYLGMPKDIYRQIPTDYPKTSALADRVLMDTLYGRGRSVDRKSLEEMWVVRRKLISLLLLIDYKWKYDSISKWEFYRVLIQRIFCNITLKIR